MGVYGRTEGSTSPSSRSVKGSRDVVGTHPTLKIQSPVTGLQSARRVDGDIGTTVLTLLLTHSLTGQGPSSSVILPGVALGPISSHRDTTGVPRRVPSHPPWSRVRTSVLPPVCHPLLTDRRGRDLVGLYGEGLTK